MKGKKMFLSLERLNELKDWENEHDEAFGGFTAEDKITGVLRNEMRKMAREIIQLREYAQKR